MFLGFSSGLPLRCPARRCWCGCAKSGVDLGTIGLFALVGTPYTIKFLWAPLTDALDVPVLSRLLGRRRGWLVFTQFLLIGGDRVSRLRAIRPHRPAWSRSARCWSPPPRRRRTS